VLLRVREIIDLESGWIKIKIPEIESVCSVSSLFLILPIPHPIRQMYARTEVARSLRRENLQEENPLAHS
jgi:hypothetical protein